MQIYAAFLAMERLRPCVQLLCDDILHEAHLHVHSLSTAKFCWQADILRLSWIPAYASAVFVKVAREI